MLDRRGGYEYEDLLACGRGEMFGPGNAPIAAAPMLMSTASARFPRPRGNTAGPDPRRTRCEAGSLVLRLPFQGRSCDAGMPGLDALWQMMALSGLERREAAAGRSASASSSFPAVMPNVRRLCTTSTSNA